MIKTILVFLSGLAIGFVGCMYLRIWLDNKEKEQKSIDILEGLI